MSEANQAILNDKCTGFFSQHTGLRALVFYPKAKAQKCHDQSSNNNSGP